jgi:hypothetical protein
VCKEPRFGSRRRINNRQRAKRGKKTLSIGKALYRKTAFSIAQDEKNGFFFDLFDLAFLF